MMQQILDCCCVAFVVAAVVAVFVNDFVAFAV